MNQGNSLGSGNRFPTFYVDDSTCEIGGRKHFILASVAFEDESRVLEEWNGKKQAFGIPPHEEVRWNSKNLSIPQRRGFVPLASSGMAIIVVDETSKHKAALSVCEQAWAYCNEEGLSGYRLRFDENIVSDWGEMKKHARSYFPPCVGLCEADSRYEHLLQAADFIAGASKLQIDFGLGIRDPQAKIELTQEVAESYALTGDEGCDLGWFMFASLRYCIWGKVAATPEKPDEPWKSTLGRGLTIHSTVPDSEKTKATAGLDRLFMGCIH
jgi:hypothetical protein